MTVERRFSLLKHDHSQYVAADSNVTITGSWTFTGVPVEFHAPSSALPTLGLENNSTAISLKYAIDPLFGLQAGVLSTGKGWIQVARTDGTATAYNLRLNPLGGVVEFGQTALITLGGGGTNGSLARFGQGAGDTTAGYVGGVGTAGNFVIGSAAGDMCFRSEAGSLLFSRDAGGTAGLALRVAGAEFTQPIKGIGNFDNPFFTYSNAGSTSNYWSWFNSNGTTRQGYVGLSATNIYLAGENGRGIVLSTAGVTRLAIDAAGAWALNGSNGAAGDILSSNGTTTPTWRSPVNSYGNSDSLLSDFVLTSNAVYTDTGLESVSLATGVRYAYELVFSAGVNVTPGMSIQLLYTGIGTATRGQRITTQGTTVTGDQYGVLPAVTSFTTTNEFMTVIKGTFTPSGAGTLKVQAKQNTSSPTSVQLRAGAYLHVWRIDGL